MKNADYRKHNDGTHNSSTYHKKDGTATRAILKKETEQEIREAITMIEEVNKLDECPKCGGFLGDRWAVKGKLQQYCKVGNCYWVGRSRTPETIPIKAKKLYTPSCGAGWHYEAFDRYGHTIVMSRSYQYKTEAVNAAFEELEKGLKDKHRGPYIVVVFPPSVEVQGDTFELEKKEKRL